jgi:hypothetical protein
VARKSRVALAPFACAIALIRGRLRTVIERVDKTNIRRTSLCSLRCDPRRRSVAWIKTEIKAKGGVAR